MKVLLVVCSFMVAMTSLAQNIIDIEFDKTITPEIEQKKDIELFKPAGASINYTLRFKDYNRPDFNDKSTRQTLRLTHQKNGNDISNDLSKPFVSYTYLEDSLNTENKGQILEINVFIPNDFYNFEKESYNLSFSHYDGFTLIAKAAVSIHISCERPEYYNIIQWNEGMPDDLEVVNAIQKDDHILVYAHRPKELVSSAYKIRLRAYERFKTVTPMKFSKTTLGLINVPIKTRFLGDARNYYSQVSLSNLGVHFGLLNLENITYFANGGFTHQSFGLGAFLLPSLQRVRFVKDQNAPSGYSTVEPFQASFFGFGVTLNYAYNGIHFHLIPFAIDFQTSAEKPYLAEHTGEVWMGLGVGYTPLSWRK